MHCKLVGESQSKCHHWCVQLRFYIIMAYVICRDGPEKNGAHVKSAQITRVGGNGTAVPVFEGEKWRRLDSNLHVRYRIASPSGSL